MTQTYTYSRALVDGGYNVNNINNTDGEGDVIPLCCDIYDSSLGKRCNIKCYEETVEITFEDPLDPTEQSNLDGVVSTYKNV